MIFLVALYGTSCKSIKTSKQIKSERIDESFVRDVFDTAVYKRQVFVEYETKFDEWVKNYQKIYQRSIFTNLVEYDTDKPVLPQTGKPPVKREASLNSTEYESVLEYQNRELRNITYMQRLTIDSLRAENNFLKQSNIKESIQGKTETKPGLSFWQQALMWSGIVFIILFIIVIFNLIKKHFKPI